MRYVETVLIVICVITAKSNSCENEQQERAELVVLLKKLRLLNLAYSRRAIPTEDVLNEMPISNLRQFVYTAQNDIPCTYVFQAMEHNRLVKRSFYFKSATSRKVIFSFLRYWMLFVKHVQIMMNDIVENCPTDCSDLMWIFYTYTEMCSECWVDITLVEDNRKRRNVQTVHEYIDNLLIEYLRSDRCAEYYQIKTNHASEISNTLSEAQFCKASLKHVTSFLRNAYRLNRLNRPADLERVSKLSMKMLRLNDALADQNVIFRILENLLVGFDWDVVVAQAECDYALKNYNTATLSSKIKSVAMVQSDFVKLSKVIILRKALDYLNYSRCISFFNWLGNVKVKHFLDKYNSEMSRHIFELVDFLDIKNDQHVQSVIKTLNQPSDAFMFTARLNLDKDDLISTIKTSISEMLTGKLLESLTITDDDKQKLILEVGQFDTRNTYDILYLLKNTESSTANFVAHIKKSFDGIEFKMINSYSQVQFSKKLRFLELSENDDE